MSMMNHHTHQINPWMGEMLYDACPDEQLKMIDIYVKRAMQ